MQQNSQDLTGPIDGLVQYNTSTMKNLGRDGSNNGSVLQAKRKKFRELLYGGAGSRGL
jgi:hypothetical protein